MNYETKWKASDSNGAFDIKRNILLQRSTSFVDTGLFNIVSKYKSCRNRYFRHNVMSSSHNDAKPTSNISFVSKHEVSINYVQIKRLFVLQSSNAEITSLTTLTSFYNTAQTDHTNEIQLWLVDLRMDPNAERWWFYPKSYRLIGYDVNRVNSVYIIAI